MRLPRRALNHEIPVAPMANLAFLLIIYFLVTNAFAAVRGIDFGFAPQERPVTVDRASAVMVAIGAAGALELDGTPVAPGALVEALRARLAAAPETYVILRPGPEAAYGDVLTVYDLLRRGRDAGVDVKHIAIPTQREIDQFWH